MNPSALSAVNHHVVTFAAYRARLAVGVAAAVDGATGSQRRRPLECRRMAAKAGPSRPGSSVGLCLPSCPGRWPRRAGSHRATPTLCPCRVRTKSKRAAAPSRRPAPSSSEFATAPFPCDGKVPRTNARSSTPSWMAGAATSPRAGAFSGRSTYSDARVLLHIPEKFDARRPAVMIVFFHGHGATLERDVRDRQRVPEQISTPAPMPCSSRRSSRSTPRI